jgi:integrase
MVAKGRVASPFVVITEKGQPWWPDSLSHAFDKGKRAAGIDKRLHDLRGTAATRFICAGASDTQVADILGWEPTRVSAIRKRYVDAGNVARSVVRLLEPAAKAR